MKRLLLLLALAVTIPMNGIFAEDYHTLKSLWAEYQKSVDADRPRQAADVLARIKKEALSKKLKADYYDAACLAYDTGCSINWRDRDSLSRVLDCDIELFGDPMMTFSYRRDRKGDSGQELLGYVTGNRNRLEGNVSRCFWNGRLYRLPDPVRRIVLEDVRDDWEYVLWALYPESSELLGKAVGERYPAGALLDFVKRTSASQRNEDTLKKYSADYDGKAVSLISDQELLEMEMSGLDRRGASSEEYKAFRDKCREYEKRRASFGRMPESGIAKACTKVSNLLETLEAKSIVSATVNDGKFSAVVRNMNRLKLEIRQSERTAGTFTLNNGRNSYYAADTLEMELENYPDGEYVLKLSGEGEEYSMHYSRFHLSLALRGDADGYSAYLADYMSGEPIGRADLELTRNGKVVCVEKGFAFNGFTRLPSKMAKLLDRNSSYQLSCSCCDSEGVLRKSHAASIWVQDFAEREDMGTNLCGCIFTDCSAFKPGDEVKFKAILYREDPEGKRHVEGADATAEVVLMDPSGKEVDRLFLKTNDSGSVAGSFKLAEGHRNGRFMLQLRSGKRTLAMTGITVDEFVLPTFDLAFDEIKGLYFVNDVIPVTGRIKTYSGHSIADADVTCTITGDVKEEVRKLDVERDGSFRIDVRMNSDDEWCSRLVKIRIVDATGETREYSRDLSVNASLSLNMAFDGAVEEAAMDVGGENSWMQETAVFSGDKAVIRFNPGSSWMFHGDADVDWKLLHDGLVVKSGSSNSSGNLTVDMSGQPSGLYSLEAVAEVRTQTGAVHKASAKSGFALIRESDRALDAVVENLFTRLGGDDIAVRFCATRGPVWALTSLYGSDNKLISSRMVHLEGGRNAASAQVDLRYEYLQSYTDVVELCVFYFRNGRQYEYRRTFKRPAGNTEIPLEITRITDRSYPSSDCILSLKTSSEVECAVSVFDSSTEKIHSNHWRELYRPEPRHPSVFYSGYSGEDSSAGYFAGYGRSASYDTDGMVMTKSTRMLAKASANVLMDNSTVGSVEMAAPMPMASVEEAEAVQSGMSEADVVVRSDFAAAIAFEPFLRPGPDGNVDFKFKTSDKLSTFVVQMYLHDMQMNTRTDRRELLVTLPAKVSVVEPWVLYEGDRYVVDASVSAAADLGGVGQTVSGKALVVVYDGDDYEKCPEIYRSEIPVSVGAGGMIPLSFPLPEVVLSDNLQDSGTLPEAALTGYAHGVRTSRADVLSLRSGILGLKVLFMGQALPENASFSDAVFVTVPVKPAVQTLVEAHSAIVMAGSDEQQILGTLRSRFVNTSPYGAVTRRISILDMVRESVPEKIVPSSKDVLSLSESLYATLLAASLSAGQDGDDKDVEEAAARNVADLERNMLDCRNADGGFGWFQGMKSSPVLTAVVVERLNSLTERGLYDDGCLLDCIEDAVRYLDRSMFGVERPAWCGGISLEQYLYVRSANAAVPLDLSSYDKKKVSTFRKAAKAYLVPSKTRGLNGEILRKARRVKTLMNLGATDEGVEFARLAGVKILAGHRLASSLKSDLRSLLEYAVEHKDGGMYYPDAVMPYRGLLESEAYAHSLLCDMWRDVVSYDGLDEFAADAANVADGIRLWLMLQKETQQWGGDAAFIEAISSVLDASSEVLDTKVLVLEKSYVKPFDEIKEAGNGFTVARKYFREDGTPLSGGEVLLVGQKIVARYEIDNGENRSFVRLNVPRPACLRPVNELSGQYGWWARPLVSGLYSFSPQGYRNVTSEGTEYWFDSYPEGKTSISEEFYVSQAGVFNSPVAEIESLYAPHYRANEAWSGLMSTGSAR